MQHKWGQQRGKTGHTGPGSTLHSAFQSGWYVGCGCAHAHTIIAFWPWLCDPQILRHMKYLVFLLSERQKNAPWRIKSGNCRFDPPPCHVYLGSISSTAENLCSTKPDLGFVPVGCGASPIGFPGLCSGRSNGVLQIYTMRKRELTISSVTYGSGGAGGGGGCDGSERWRPGVYEYRQTNEGGGETDVIEGRRWPPWHTPWSVRPIKKLDRRHFS